MDTTGSTPSHTTARLAMPQHPYRVAGIPALNMEMSNLTEEIKINVVPRLPHPDNTDKIIEMLEYLEKSKGENWFNRTASLSSIIGLIITVI